MNIDELKQSWNTIDARLESLENSARDMERRVTANRVATSRDRLKAIARNMAIICFLAPLTCVPVWRMAPLLTVVICVFFIVMGVLQVHSYVTIDSVHLSNLTVTDALKSVYSLERMRHNKRMIGMVLGIPIVAAMLYTFYSWNDLYLFYGACCGTVIGTVIGLMINRRNVELLKAMRRELESNL